MALNNIIRRVSTSKVVPLAVRFVAGSQRHHHHCSTLFSTVNRRSDICGFLNRRTLPSALHCYSAPPASDEALIRVLQEEIECAKEVESAEKVAVEVLEGFPFKLEDNPGHTTVTLSREYQGEKIVVEVGMPSLVTGEEEEEDAGGEDDDNDEKPNSSDIPLVVRVSRNKGPCLEFACTAYPDEISIDSLSLKDPDTTEDELAYEGPDFSDLDENLQKAFLKYLEIRGVKPSTTNFLHEYMINKDSREYLLWLNNIKQFIES